MRLKLDVTNQIHALRRLHHCHGVQLCHNVFSRCQYLIIYVCSIIEFLGDNGVACETSNQQFKIIADSAQPKKALSITQTLVS